MINNTFLSLSLRWWLWCFLWGTGPKRTPSRMKVLVSSFKVTRFRLIGLGCSDDDRVTPIMPWTVHVQIVLMSHKHCLLILTLTPWELLQHRRGIGWRVKRTDSDHHHPPPHPEGLGLKPESLLASGSDLNSAPSFPLLGNEVTEPCLHEHEEHDLMMLGSCKSSTTLASSVGSSTVEMVLIDSTHTQDHHESSLISFPCRQVGCGWKRDSFSVIHQVIPLIL